MNKLLFFSTNLFFRVRRNRLKMKILIFLSKIGLVL